MVLEPLIQGFELFFNFNAILMSFFGTFLGLILGVIPGLGGLMGMILLLPFMLLLDPVPAMALLIGIFIGGSCGGCVSAILLRIPGTPLAAVTLLDGYPLAQKGKASEAISIATSASAVGGLIGGVVLIIGSTFLAKIALHFAAPEFFMLAVTGLLTIAIVSHESTLKGLMTGVFGLFIATIGMDFNVMFYRFHMGIEDLKGGIGLLTLVLGLFAISEMFIQLGKSQFHIPTKIGKIRFTLYGLRLITNRLKNLLRSSFVGTVLGALPGVGGLIASFTAYAMARSDSKNPEEFGKGSEDGVIACESANNACCGGALVPSLALGIPGDATTSVLIGALILLGFLPGPDMFESSLDVVGGIFWAYLMGNIALLFLTALMLPMFVYVLRLPRTYLVPTVIFFCIISAFSIQSSIFDVWVMLVFGVIGYLLRRYGFPLAPIVIGFVLGPICEVNFRRSLVMSGDDYSIFWSRTVSAILLTINVLLILWLLLPKQYKEKIRFWKKLENQS